jgi:hypothetical protein
VLTKVQQLVTEDPITLVVTVEDDQHLVGQIDGCSRRGCMSHAQAGGRDR